MNECLCGCGTILKERDARGVRRRFASGHNARRHHHPKWKGKTPGSHNVHAWLLRNHPKTGTCEICGATPERKKRSPTQFAFKHHPAPHTRNRSDYYEVCIPCHRALDRLSYVGKEMPRSQSLTPAEVDVLVRMADGATASQVARDIGRSREAVNDRLRSASRRLGARNVSHAVAIYKASENHPGGPPGTAGILGNLDLPPGVATTRTRHDERDQ